MNGWRIAANLATLANALVGVGAIAYILLGNPLFAMLLIAIGIGFDGLDGILSRRSGLGGSTFGRIADSIADSITFGLAPALLIAYHANQGSLWGSYAVVGYVVGAVYLALALTRLVRFTAHHYRQPDFFGTPTPIAALAVTWFGAAFYVPAFLTVQPLVFYGFAAPFALLMVAPWAYPKMRRGARLRIPMAITGVAAAVMLVPFQFRPAPDAAAYAVALAGSAVMGAGLFLYYVIGPFTLPHRSPDPPSAVVP
ncbi:MAG: CDP-alcohol phosphatidyltransferase family protein [Candidatus Thermoplasmatota archaeon]|jgi:CDP-diacylglycerol--serine O-phosphatidyltransferase|nr:CDP-alcohol phosphatidyltransferase family protein [Candidatus Thermoplasmatota archaeon]MCL5983303.1 CDP-alcohol phosphatidyltransferase family protein [Candidatus Thermoplasmatota archaeon]